MPIIKSLHIHVPDTTDHAEAAELGNILRRDTTPRPGDVVTLQNGRRYRITRVETRLRKSEQEQ